MKQFSTDVLSLAAIAGCAALSIGATAALLDGPRHVHDCVVNLEQVSERVIAGDVSVMVRPGIYISTGDSCAELEEQRRKRRRRRPHVDHDHDRIEVRVMRARERADHARARGQQVRERAMERAVEREMRAVERQMRAVERRLEASREALERSASELGASPASELTERIEGDLRVLEQRLEELAERRRRRPR